jgi:hypothetical protein
LPTDTYPDADLPTVADLPAVSYRATRPHTDLPADAHPIGTNADLSAVSY